MSAQHWRQMGERAEFCHNHDLPVRAQEKNHFPFRRRFARREPNQSMVDQVASQRPHAANFLVHFARAHAKDHHRI